MTTSIGRGRGYTGRNKDLRKLSSDGQVGIKLPLSSQNSVTKTFQTRNNVNYYNVNPQAMSHATTATNIKVDLQRTEDKGRHVSLEGQSLNLKYEENEMFADENVQSVLYMDEKYSHLIEQIGVLQPSDDGILINQKIRHIEGILTKTCTQYQHLSSAMEAVAVAAILDTNLAKKISKMISWSRFQLFQKKISNVFMLALKDKLDGIEISLEGADQYLINASNLLTDIYTESKTLDSEDLTMLVHFIVDVFISLLECNTPASLKTLNVHLMVHGKDLYPKAMDKFDNISLSVRKLIIARQAPLPSCRIWLALLCDQSIYRFQPLPQYLQLFYGRHLDDSHQDEPRDSRFANDFVASTECYNSKLSDGKTKRNSVKSDSSDKWSTTSNGERPICKNNLADDVFEEKSHENSTYGEYHPDSVNDMSNGQLQHERKPRPILGAGSRMLQLQKLDVESEMNFGGHNDENSADIPKFCPSVPPPNYKPKSVAPAKQTLTASQDGMEYWNHPPPKLPPSNLNKRLGNSGQSSLAKRLETWRSESEVADKPSDLQIEEYNNDIKSQNDSHKSEEFNVKKWGNEKELKMENLHVSENNCQRDRKKLDESGENEKKWNRNSANMSDSKKLDAFKKDSSRNKKEAEDKELSWRRRDSDDGKMWDSASSDKKSVGRKDSRGNAKSKRDTMEVSRKASYWTHDDRCDKDYDG